MLRRQRRWTVAALWLAAFVLALLLDRRVSAWVARAPLFDPKYNSPWKWPKRFGEFQYIVPVIILVGIFHRRKWRGAVMLLWASTLARALYSILKWVVGRQRPSADPNPFHLAPFTGGLRGLIDAGSLACPSGHATFG